MEKIRVQKLLSDAGYCSRRKAEALIESGKVKNNGRPVRIGDKALPTDLITVDGERVYIPRKKEFRYIMMNKPRGYVTTLADEQGRRCVTDLLEGVDTRVYPIGRLDRNSEGLLLFTNDGAFANSIMHPSREVTKTYRVTVKAPVTEEQLTQMSAGVELDDGFKTAPANIVTKVSEPTRVVLLVTIHEGKKREVRRMCDAVGLEVMRLRRISIGPVKLGMLKPGAWRDLTAEELRALRTAAGKQEKKNK
ncbi:MAG: rRNA pseudouridine synthase [Oscillospiraceae bacterium]|nr:rRNA pseudouridine synthase [Oscillospiraceae bacterium]